MMVVQYLEWILWSHMVQLCCRLSWLRNWRVWLNFTIRIAIWYVRSKCLLVHVRGNINCRLRGFYGYSNRWLRCITATHWNCTLTLCNQQISQIIRILDRNEEHETCKFKVKKSGCVYFLLVLHWKKSQHFSLVQTSLLKYAMCWINYTYEFNRSFEDLIKSR